MNNKVVYKFINVACLVIILISVLYIVIKWPSISNEVPIHYNALGEADGFGDKKSIIMLPILNFIMFGMIWLSEKFPSMWNTGVKITPENKNQVYGLIYRMINIQKLLTAVMFTTLTIASVNGSSMEFTICIGFIVLIFINIGTHVVKIFKFR